MSKEVVMCALCGRKTEKKVNCGVYVPEGWRALIKTGFAILHCDRCVLSIDKATGEPKHERL
jgi:hypothetical protein